MAVWDTKKMKQEIKLLILWIISRIPHPCPPPLSSPKGSSERLHSVSQPHVFTILCFNLQNRHRFWALALEKTLALWCFLAAAARSCLFSTPFDFFHPTSFLSSPQNVVAFIYCAWYSDGWLCISSRINSLGSGSRSSFCPCIPFPIQCFKSGWLIHVWIKFENKLLLC